MFKHIDEAMTAYHWPTNAQYQVTQHFGENPDYYAALGYAGHHGIDIACPEGTSVYACEGGAASFYPNDPTAGNFVIIHHSGGLTTRYLHLSSFEWAGNHTVYRGELLGLSGNTGLSEGPHLHFEVIDPTQWGNGYQGRVDPLPYFKEDDGAPSELDWSMESEDAMNDEQRTAVAILQNNIGPLPDDASYRLREIREAIQRMSADLTSGDPTRVQGCVGLLNDIDAMLAVFGDETQGAVATLKQ